MKKYLFVLFLAITVIACKKTDNQNIEPSGIYNEVSPYGGNTRLNFVNSNKIIIAGGQLNNQFFMSLDTNVYQIINQRILFISDSANIKDTTAFWLQLTGSDSLTLSTCSFGVPCYASGSYFIFKKQG
jgi:hypothetical protein